MMLVHVPLAKASHVAGPAESMWERTTQGHESWELWFIRDHQCNKLPHRAPALQGLLNQSDTQHQPPRMYNQSNQGHSITFSPCTFALMGLTHSAPHIRQKGL